jgi:ketosteroid isomerase-like protein
LIAAKYENLERLMNNAENSKVVLDAISAVEQRNDRQFRELLYPDFEIHWPPSLPYGESSRDQAEKIQTWSETWEPLQPTEAERKMNARVVAAAENEVTVLWRQRGLTPSGDRFDGEVLRLYQVRDGKLARAQMFYFDTMAVARFLTKAAAQTERRPRR